MKAFQVLVLAATTAVHAETIDINWIVPTTEDERKEVQYFEVKAGDKLKFNWVNAHNVVRLKKCDPLKKHKPSSFTCDGPTKQYWGESGAEFNIPAGAKTGAAFCFICTVADSSGTTHCMQGQHSTVVVKNDDPVVDPNAPKTIPITWKTQMKKTQMTARLGDTLEFSYGSSHNLIRTECAAVGASFPCGGRPLEYWGDSDTRKQEVTVEAANYAVGDRICFYCSKGNHCQKKQYLTVTVVDAQADEGGDEDQSVMNDIKTLCQLQTKSSNCKACGGSMKNKNGTMKCIVKQSKFVKMTCDKISGDADFCTGVGCTSVDDEGTLRCEGTLGENMPPKRR